MVLWLAALLAFQPAAAADPQESDRPARQDIGSGISQSLLLAFLADNATLTLIDARSADEFAESHIAGAINLPHDSRLDAIDQLPPDFHSPIVVYCRTGKRAAMLRDRLRDRGYTDVNVLQPEQIFWSEGLAVLNCGTSSPQNSAGAPGGNLASRSKEETQ